MSAVSLKRSFGPFQLWALAVGLVISGEYFGWSYGWSVGGTYSFLASTLLVTVLYTTLIFSFTELTTSIPDAGGPYAYALRAFGKSGGMISGVATSVEFLFATPAIAFALGSYLHVIFPSISSEVAAVSIMLLFGLINLFPLKHSMRFELVVTIIAVVELLIFLCVVGPYFRWENFSQDAWRGGGTAIFAGIPYAIWFFLAIEGVAMSAEEVIHPSKNIPLGYLAGIFTLVFFALAVMFACGGVGDWKLLAELDYPIPKAVAMALGEQNPWVKAFASVGLFGLIASLNGIVFSASRQIFALARSGAVLPQQLAKINSQGIPVNAVLFTTGFGIVALLSGKTNELITLAAIGAVVMYMISMASLLALRKKEPDLLRPYKTPFYPYFPIISFGLSLVCFLAMTYYHTRLVGVFFLLVLLVYGYELATRARRHSYPAQQQS